MTVVLSYCNEYMSVIMADDRVNYGKYQQGGYSDGNSKLINLSDMGWASGAGVSDYLNDLKTTLSNSTPTNTDDIKEIFNQVIEENYRKDPHLIEDINKSVAVVSWLGSDGHSLLFRVGILTKHNDEGSNKLYYLKNGNIDIVYPGNYINDLELVESLEQKHQLNIGSELTLEEILEKMFRLFKEITSNSIYCSDHCDVGVLIYHNHDVHKIKISGNIDYLLEKLENNELVSTMELVSSYNL